MISSLVSKRTDREFETSIDSLIKLSQTGCSQTLLICTPMQLKMAVLVHVHPIFHFGETSHAFC
jgi:hypothetical protein